MGKGQKARMANAASNKLQPGAAIASTPVFVPGKGLVHMATPTSSSSSSSSPLAHSQSSSSSSSSSLKKDVPSTGNSPSSKKLTIDNNAILSYLSLPLEIRVPSLEKHLGLRINRNAHAEALSITEGLSMLKVAENADDSAVECEPLTLNSAELASIAYRRGLFSPDGSRIVLAMMMQVKNGEESGLILLNKMLESYGRSLEPFVVPLISKLLDLQSDKSVSIRDTAFDAARKCIETLCPYSSREIFPSLLKCLDSNDWRVKVSTLTLMDMIAARESGQLSVLLPQIIPVVSECMKDPKKQVREIGDKAMRALCSSITNEDIVHLVPQLVSVISHPEESVATLDLLMETTFVATVDAATLALITPLLIKSLKERSSPMKRKAARVIDNMCRLVQNPADVAPFMPFLLPALDKVVDENSNVEIVEVAREAREILVNAMSKGENGPKENDRALSSASLRNQMFRLFQTVLPCAPSEGSSQAQETVYTIIGNYVSSTTANLIVYTADCSESLPQAVESLSLSAEELWHYVASTTPSSRWADCVAPYVAPLMPEETEEGEVSSSEEQRVAYKLRNEAMGSHPDREHDQGPDSADDLCNIEFSLAFGGKILLHNTQLKLGRGHMYGIMGKNGAGKTTLLTNIGSGNIEGLPESLRTVYVQHDDQSQVDRGLGVLEELLGAREMVELGVGEEEAREALQGIGFTSGMLTSPRSALSGGWKMKLLIIKAMLSKADVLLLDEPTNHLDKESVDWLAEYLKAQRTVTALIVSHDPDFLDRVITDVIHYENRKLVYYPGSLRDFVKLHPEAKYYYELSGSTLKFTFPTPDRLDGIASTTKAILKLDHVSYTYPGASAPTIEDASVRVCLASRIAVTGKNGAGKSTLIKMLVQETAPDEGGHPEQEVWKHRNLRLAYVAQHSFHHVEQHLDSSPVDYIKWRFADGYDKEDMAKASTELSDAEKQPKKLGDVDEVLGRRKNGRTMEYECSIVGQGQYEENVYITCEKLIEMGHQKLVTQCDAKIAAAVAGLDVRPLVTKEIQSHLNDFNLEAEYGTHSKIRLLSGGQKVKLVLAAAMWNRPHVIVLDEPTNYLDREALAALTEAIKAFSGGIVIISHNSDFTKAICTEEWHIENGRCTVQGNVKETQMKTKSVMTRKEKNNKEDNELAMINASEKDGVNLNKTKLVHKEHLKNPRTLEYLTKVEIRKLTKLAKAAGMPLKEYVGKITKDSPEWKWL